MTLNINFNDMPYSHNSWVSWVVLYIVVPQLNYRKLYLFLNSYDTDLTIHFNTLALQIWGSMGGPKTISR